MSFEVSYTNGRTWLRISESQVLDRFKYHGVESPDHELISMKLTGDVKTTPYAQYRYTGGFLLSDL